MSKGPALSPRPGDSVRALSGLCIGVGSRHGVPLFGCSDGREVCMEKWLAGLLSGVGSGMHSGSAVQVPAAPHSVSLCTAWVVSHPATWLLRKAVVLSKEGAQLFRSWLCLEFPLLSLPWKAGLLRCHRAAFGGKHVNESLPDPKPATPACSAASQTDSRVALTSWRFFVQFLTCWSSASQRWKYLLVNHS